MAEDCQHFSTKIVDINEENIEWLMQTSQTVENFVDDTENATEVKKLNIFLSLLESEFQSKVQLNETTAFGILKNEENFQNLLRKLKAFGYFFAVRTSRACKGTVSKIFHKNSDHPYSMNKSVRLNCSAEIVNKQMNCPAYLIMRQVNIFPSFPKSSKERQHHVNQKIRKAMKTGQIEMEQQFWVSISLPKTHNHALEPEKNQPRRILDPEVKATMFQLSSEQKLTIPQVKTQLKLIVDREFAQKDYQPSPSNRAFFPSDKVIYNHLRDCVKKSRKRKSTDEDTLRAEITETANSLLKILPKLQNKTILNKLNKLLEPVKEITEKLK